MNPSACLARPAGELTARTAASRPRSAVATPDAEPGAHRRSRPSSVPALQRRVDGAWSPGTDTLDAAASSTPSMPAASPTLQGHSAHPSTVPVTEVVGRGGGAPLPVGLRADMEERLGADFSDVRIHSGASAAASATGIEALAYTAGHDVVFGPSAYAPETEAGRHTIAHELTHVVQQRRGPVAGTDTGNGVALSDPSDSYEREAEATATEALRTPVSPSDAGGGDTPVPGALPGAHRLVTSRQGSTQVASAAPAVTHGGVTVQRHPLPTAQANWQAPPAPPGIWHWLTHLFSRGGGTAPAHQPPAAQPPTTAGPGAAAATPEITSAGAETGYASAALAVKANWSTYASADARGIALGQAAATTLTNVRVHPLLPPIMADLPVGNGGNFDFRTWSLTLSRLPFAPATVSDAVFDNVYTIVFHEARHCEQWYRMARLRAGAGQTAAQIRTAMSIPADVALAACGNPIAPGSAEAAEALVWWNSVYGTNAAARGTTLTEVMAALNAYNAAIAADPAQSLPATQAAVTRMTTAYAAYRALPEEADAFGTETSVRAALAAAAAHAAAQAAAHAGAGATPPAATPPATPPVPSPPATGH